MNEQTKSFWVGVFVIAGIAVTAGLLLFLKPAVGDGAVTLRVLFSNIAHVTKGTRVTYAGRQVGEVKKIHMVRNPREAPADADGNLYIYELILKVDSNVKVYSYDEIMFATTGLLGEKAIAIIPKMTPRECSPPTNVTNDVLYAQSNDKLEKALAKLTDVADNLNDFIDENADEFHQALTNVNTTMTKIDRVATEALDRRIFERMSRTFESVERIFVSFESEEGTLGKLLHSDTFYLQMTAVLFQLETLLSDINNYGLLFQYNKVWQRKQMKRHCQLYALCRPCDFYNYFNKELSSIDYSVGKIGNALRQMECRQIPLQDPCFPENACDLLNRIEYLQTSLQNYRDVLMQSDCQK